MFTDAYNQEDPLGLGVKGRARERRLTASLQGLTSPIGPLPDQNWDGFFQAADEAAAGRHVRFAGSPYSEPGSNQLHGYTSQPPPAQPQEPESLRGLRGVSKLKRRKR
jgi:hypothetical protein